MGDGTDSRSELDALDETIEVILRRAAGLARRADSDKSFLEKRLSKAVVEGLESVFGEQLVRECRKLRRMTFSAALWGADHELLGMTAVEAVSPTAAIALSRGAQAKQYRYTDANEDVVACHLDGDRVALVVADGHNGRESSGEAVAAVARRVGGLRLPPSVDLFIDVFWDAQEAVRNATQRPGAPNPESRTALALAVIGDTEVFWASMGDGDVFLCDRTIEPLSPRRSYFLGWPMTRAELAERLETGNTAVPDGAVVVVASDGLRDFADPLGRGRAQLLSLLADAPDAAVAAKGLVDLACACGAGDNVAVGVAQGRALGSWTQSGERQRDGKESAPRR